MQKLENDYKIHILCPKNHRLYPQGIKPKTFIKSSRLSYNQLELVKEGYDSTEMKNFMIRMGASKAKNIWVSKDLPLSEYRLDKKQFEQWGRKCKVCTGEIVLKEEEKSPVFVKTMVMIASSKKSNDREESSD